MDKRDLEELDLGIELALSDQEQAAHFIFTRLSDSHPANSSLLALCAYTASDPAQAQAALETAIKLDPANPLLPVSRAWLKENKLNRSKPPASSLDTFIALASAEATVSQSENANTQTSEETSKTPQPAKPKETAKPPQPKPKQAAKPPQPLKPPTKPGIKLFSGIWWGRLACSLLFFGSAMVLLFMLVTANNLTENEKAYANRIGQLNQQTKEANARIQAAVEQFNAGKLAQPELADQLRQLVSLGEQFKTLKSPSQRFDKLDGLLGEAFSYFNEGATSLINGLAASDTALINEGNRLLGMGNDYLRQARDELKALGG